MDLFGRRLHCHPAVQVSSESQGCHESLASLCPTDALLTPYPLHCLTCRGNWSHWSFGRDLLNEQHFYLTCLWVYFLRWLMLIGAFWLYSAHLGSLWAV